jgi:flagellar biosynthesis protein FlhA
MELNVLLFYMLDFLLFACLLSGPVLLLFVIYSVGNNFRLGHSLRADMESAPTDTGLICRDSIGLSEGFRFPQHLARITLLRILLNVFASGLIVFQGHRFGSVVIGALGGMLCGESGPVGLFLFLLLVLWQFLVLRKGTELFAKAAAGFTLEILPARQMKIDADLAQNLITEKEAEEKRTGLCREADFYGSMDGMGKFLYLDFIIILVMFGLNVFGGMAAGNEDYLLLAAGNGLVFLTAGSFALIAAVLISLACD